MRRSAPGHRFPNPIKLLPAALFVAACGGGASVDQGTLADLGTAVDGGGSNLASAADLASSADLASTPDLAPSGPTPLVVNFDISTGGCYTLAGGTHTSDNPCPADIDFLAGAMVDISAADGSSMSLCQLPGTYARVQDVPVNDVGCAFSGYVEGGGGLRGAGLLVRDRANTHLYRWHITSNTLPNIQLEQLQIR